MIIGRFQKQPIDRLDYDIDFTEFLGTDTIISVGMPDVPDTAASPAGLTIDNTAITNNATFVKVTVSGGTTGVNYKVTVTVLTGGGRIKQVEFYVKVKED